MRTDDAQATESQAVGAKMGDHEALRWHCHALLIKRDDEGQLLELIEETGNLLVTSGIVALWQSLRGDTLTAFSNANARIGVGDATTAEAIGQTDLQATTNKARQGMDTGFPKVGVADGLAANQIQFQATFGAGAGNFQWNEWGVFNAATAGTMLNRKVPSPNLGTKTGGSWTLQITVSIS